MKMHKETKIVIGLFIVLLIVLNAIGSWNSSSEKTVELLAYNEKTVEINEFYYDYLILYEGYAFHTSNEQYWIGHFNALIENANFGATIFTTSLKTALDEHKIVAEQIEEDTKLILELLERTPEESFSQIEIDSFKRSLREANERIQKNNGDMGDSYDLFVAESQDEKPILKLQSPK